MSAPAAQDASGSATTHWLLLGALVVLFGSAFILIKIAVESLPPLILVAIRLSVAALALGAGVLLTGRRLPRLIAPSGRGLCPEWRLFGLLAVTGNILPFALISWGSQAIDSSLAGILMAIMPLSTMALAALFVPGEHITSRRLGGFVLGFVGIIVLFGPSALGLAGSSSIPHQLAMIAAALCYAVSAVLMKRLGPHHPVVAGTAIHLCAVALIIPIALWSDWPLSLMPSSLSLLCAVLLGLFSSAMATLLLLALVRRAGPTFASQINYLIPLWAVAMGYVFLNEVPGFEALLALILILSGIGLSQTGPRKTDTD